MDRVLRVVVSSLLLALAGWVGAAPDAAAAAADVGASAGAAEACDDVDPRNEAAIRNRAEGVTTVFVGEVRGAASVRSTGGGEGRVNDPSGSPTGAPQQPDATVTRWVHAVVVEVAFRGRLGAGDRVTVVTEPAGDNGLGKLTPGEVYLFFVDGEKGMNLPAGACGATRLPGGLDAELERLLERTLAEREPSDAPPEVELTEPDDGASGAPSLSRLAAPGVALALIGVLGLLLVSRMGRRRT